MTARPPRIVERDAVVWPVSSSRIVSTITCTRSRGEPQLLAGDLLERRVDALAHLGPRVEQRHGAVGLGSQDRLALLEEAVADPVVLHAAPDPGEPGARGTRRAPPSRHSLIPTPGPSTWPVPNVSPTSSALRQRISQPSTPTARPDGRACRRPRTSPGSRRTRASRRTAGCSCRRRAPRRRRWEPVRPARVARPRAPAPCRRRSRTRRCRPTMRARSAVSRPSASAPIV